MKKTMKLIAMLTVITLLTGLLAVAIADDKIYTSPTFKIPKDRVVILPDPEPEPEASIEEGTEPEEQPAEEPAEEPAPETPAEEETEPTEQPVEESAPETPIEEETEPAEQPVEEPAPEKPAKTEQKPAEEPAPETPTEEETEPAEQPVEEPTAEEPVSEEPAETENKPAEKPAAVERKVLISSSRKDTVIRDQFITLYSELVGFEGLTPHYQWQVDRGDGNGWVDVEGATGATHSFVARPDTILYNWRLIVTVDE
jgi:FtsZ-interacting cell division protein ZipA